MPIQPEGYVLAPDYTGVSTARFKALLQSLAAGGDFIAMGRRCGCDEPEMRALERIRDEELQFTGVNIVDCLGMTLGYNFFQHLEVVPSKVKGSAKKMAIDILWMAWANSMPDDMSLEELAAIEFVPDEQALQTLIRELEDKRNEELGQPTEKQARKAEKMRKTRADNLKKARANKKKGK